MALRQIRLFDDEILRKKSKLVKVVDDKIRQILNDMADTMYNTENGGGLAKCFYHEIDHLEGILFTDLVTEYI